MIRLRSYAEVSAVHVLLTTKRLVIKNPQNPARQVTHTIRALRMRLHACCGFCPFKLSHQLKNHSSGHILWCFTMWYWHVILRPQQQKARGRAYSPHAFSVIPDWVRTILPLRSHTHTHTPNLHTQPSSLQSKAATLDHGEHQPNAQFQTHCLARPVLTKTTGSDLWQINLTLWVTHTVLTMA